MTSISSFKRLSEPAWKSMAAKHKIRDNGLSKALSECAKQAVSEEYDSVLKSLVQVTDLAGKLRKEKEIALNRDLCAYLDELAKEVGKARSAVAAEQKAADESEAEDAESDAEAKLTQALRVQILAGLQKAKAMECSALVCVATPVYAVMVAQSITAKHKALLTQVTGSTKFLALVGFVWDQESNSYSCIMDKRDAALKLKLEAAFKYYTATSVKVSIVVRSEYEQEEAPENPEPPETKEYKEKAYAPAKKSAKPSAGGAAGEVETEQESSESEEAREEPLLTGVRPFDISGSVGQGGKNAPDDVAQVQIALNRKGARLEVDGKIGGQTIGAIKSFQKQIGIAYPDGLVEVGKKTATALASSGSGAKYAGGGNGGGGQYGGGNGGGGQYGGGTDKYSGGGTGQYSGGGTGKYAGGGTGNYSGGGTGKYTGGGTGKYSGGGSGQYGGGGGSGQYGAGGTGQYGGGGTGQYGGGGSGQYGGDSGQYGGGGSGQYGGGGGPRQYETGGSGNAGTGGSSGSSGETITGQAGFSQPESTLDRVENAAGQAFEKQRSKVEDTLEGLKNSLGGDPE